MIQDPTHYIEDESESGGIVEDEEKSNDNVIEKFSSLPQITYQNLPEILQHPQLDFLIEPNQSASQSSISKNTMSFTSSAEITIGSNVFNKGEDEIKDSCIEVVSGNDTLNERGDETEEADETERDKTEEGDKSDEEDQSEEKENLFAFSAGDKVKSYYVIKSANIYFYLKISCHLQIFY